jgi:hypothetical protein
MSKPILAWHFLTNDRLPKHGQRKRPLKVGDVMRVKGTPILCERGLHASERILDALAYAPGPVVCRVEVSGTIVHGVDKLAGTRRKILGMGDIETLLHEWACDVAEEACRRADVLDGRSLEAIEVKRRWLRGESTYDELTAAEDAAWAVAGAAARDTAWAAAGAAAWVTAGAAAGVTARAAADAAARAAAWAVAGAAARDTARAAAWATLNADLGERVLQAIGGEP